MLLHDLWRLPEAGLRALWEIIGYQPSADQLLAHLCQLRLKLLTGGERAGKSRFSAEELFIWVFCDAAAHGDNLFWLVGPDYRQCRGEFWHLLADLQKLNMVDPSSLSMPKDGSWSLRTITGSTVETRSSQDALTLASVAPAGILMCEAAQQAFEVFLRCRGRVAEKRGPLVLSGTFESSQGWYADYWRAWQGANLDGGKSFSLPTWGNLALYPGGRNDPEIKALEATYPPDQFQERFGAVPCPPATLVYKDFSFVTHVKALMLPKDLPVQLFVDPGYAAAYAVLFVYIERGEVYVFDEVHARGLVVQDIIARCKERACWPRVTRIIMDIAGTQHPAQESQATVWNRMTGLPVFTQPVAIYDGIVRVRTFLKNPENHGEPRIFFDPKCKGTLREFGLYKYATSVEGRAEKEDPIKADDHSMDALRYGLVANFGLSDIARPRRRNREVNEILERV